MLDLTFSPPEVAKRLGVRPSKIISWIRSGQLKAIDVSNGTKRPRFRITAAALKEFEEIRAVQPLPSIRRRRTKKPDLSRFFGPEKTRT